MNWFEKEYGKRFKKASSKEGVDEQQLWENIINSPEMKKPPSNRQWLGFISGICFLGLCLFLFIFLKSNVDQPQNQESKNINSIIPNNNKIENKELNQEENNISENKELNNSINLENKKTQNLSDSQNELNIVNAKSTNLDSNMDLEKENPLNAKGNTNRLANQPELTREESNQEETNRSNGFNKDVNGQQDNISNDSRLTEVALQNTANTESTNLNGTHSQTPVNKVKDHQFANHQNSNADNPMNSADNSLNSTSQGESNSQAILKQESEDEGNNENNVGTPIVDPSQKLRVAQKELADAKAERNIWSQNLAPMPSLDLNEIESDPQTIDLDELNLYMPTQPIRQIKKTAFSILPKTIEFSIGTTIHNHNFKEASNNQEFSNLLQDALNVELGKSFGLQFKWPLSNSLYINSGIQWTQTENRFQFMLENDTLIQRSNGSLIPAVNFRNVRHHNKYEVLSIPFELGYHKSIKSFGFGISLGLAYNMELKESGKLLNQDKEIISYTDGMYNNNFISFRFKPSISYQLSDRYIINASLLGSYQSHQPSDIIGQKFNSIWWNPSIGISLRY